MTGDELDDVRRIALALPMVIERVSHGEPCFFVDGKRPICYFHDNHGGDGRVSLWCPAPPGVAAELTSSDPRRFFVRRHPRQASSRTGSACTSNRTAMIASTGAKSRT